MIPDMLAGPVQGTLPLYSSTYAAMHSGGGSFRLANGSLAGVTGLQEGSDCLPWSLCNPSGSRYLPAAIASEPHRLVFHDQHCWPPGAGQTTKLTGQLYTALPTSVEQLAHASSR